MLRNHLRQGEREWAAGRFQADTIEKTALLNAEAVGKHSALKDLVEMEYEDYLSHAEDEEDGSA